MAFFSLSSQPFSSRALSLTHDVTAVKRQMAKKSNAIIIFYYFSPWEINLRSLCGVCAMMMEELGILNKSEHYDDETKEV
jgi:hypothetical protein